jgi:hypothetical protein
MNHLKYVLTILIMLIVAPVSTASEAWKPEAKFSLEGSTLKETLLWVSGFSYAVDAMGERRINVSSHKQTFCSPENGYIGSRVLFEILNERFAGQTITSEQATEEIMKQLPKRFPC